jgi:KamA family protein
VILSGGDPLSLSTDSLGSLLTSLADIRHLKRIRFHTRFPIGIPERIDKFLLNQLQNVSQQVFFVLHTNHPREFDEEVLKALTKLKSIGIPLLNQTVLLKGVNDKEEILLSLCKELINHGILPYYLHLLDKVSGSAHFEVSAERGKELIRYLHEHLSGFGVPKLVREEAGEKGKTLIA